MNRSKEQIAIDKAHLIHLLAEAERVALVAFPQCVPDIRGIREKVKRTKSEITRSKKTAQVLATSALPTANKADLPLPTEAPELWNPARTKSSKENPASFIRRVYAGWLGNGLTRAHIGTLDEALYAAYAAHITPKRHPEDKIPELPERSSKADNHLKNSGISSRADALELRRSSDPAVRREGRRLYAAAVRRGM